MRSSTEERIVVLSDTGKTIIECLNGFEDGTARVLRGTEDQFFEVEGAVPALKKLTADGLITIKHKPGSYGKIYRIISLVV